MTDLGIVTIVQARFGSSRLPGKALKSITGRPMLAHVLARAEAIGWPVLLATSDAAPDDAVEKVAQQADVPVFRGSEWDVLGRMAGAARAAEARIVIRITGDCPLIAPDVAREVVQLYCQCGGIATNDTSTSGWPDGLDIEVFMAADLYEADARATEKADREHVTPWLRRQRPHAILKCAEDWRAVKLSVDTPDDYTRVKEIVKRLNGASGFDWPATRAAIQQWEADRQ